MEMAFSYCISKYLYLDFLIKGILIGHICINMWVYYFIVSIYLYRVAVAVLTKY